MAKSIDCKISPGVQISISKAKANTKSDLQNAYVS